MLDKAVEWLSDTNQILKYLNECRIFDITHIFDHHAIIPTLNNEWHRIIKNLDSKQQQILSLIVQRLFGM
jgi:DNA topoisomerase IA